MTEDEISIRPYTTTDFETVTSIWLRSWESTSVVLARPATLAGLRERWTEEIAGGWIVHVATMSGEIVGFAALHGDRLRQLFVAPERQGRGIGKRLLGFVKAQIPGGFVLHTATASRAGSFYEREGLVRGETELRQGFQITHYAWLPLPPGPVAR